MAIVTMEEFQQQERRRYQIRRQIDKLSRIRPKMVRAQILLEMAVRAEKEAKPVDKIKAGEHLKECGKKYEEVKAKTKEILAWFDQNGVEVMIETESGSLSWREHESAPAAN